MFIGLLVTVNTIITGGDVQDIPVEEQHVFFDLPILGTPVSAESLIASRPRS